MRTFQNEARRLDCLSVRGAGCCKTLRWEIALNEEARVVYSEVKAHSCGGLGFIRCPRLPRASLRKQKEQPPMTSTMSQSLGVCDLAPASQAVYDSDKTACQGEQTHQSAQTLTYALETLSAFKEQDRRPKLKVTDEGEVKLLPQSLRVRLS
ncbi:hypothetical protein GJAV_G00128520 [Gymnothorax javanicus]|nr:hypothetical protein GJAV_G00128520 [Gymnothorax javanicus]